VSALNEAYSLLLSEDELDTFLVGEGYSPLPDEEKVRLLTDASAWICKVTNQFFAEREGELLYNGNGGTRLPSKYPILSITKVEEQEEAVEAEFVEIEAKYFKVKRDRIIRIGDTWYEGHDNIRVNGTFGWEGDETAAVPYLIKRACKLLILNDLDPNKSLNSRIRSESVGGHSVNLEAREQRAKFTGDLDVDLILVKYMYKPPVPKVRLSVI